MSQSLMLKIKGLWTNNNSFSEVPDGALAVASNIVIDKDSVAESRRGFSQLFTSSSSVGRISEFQSQVIAHYGTTLGTWNGSSLSAFTGSYSNPSSTVTMKFAQQNQNLYFTTSLGVYKLDVLSNNPVPSGIPAALDVEAAVTGSSGFINTQSSCAYRIVWGFNDANNNLLLGAPSQRAQADNSSASVSANANVTFTIPAGITVNNFYQIYRSDQIAFTGSTPNTPDDNMQLVFEGNPTSGQITAKSITVLDNTPDSLKGAALYTNATQQGILQQNTIPPFCNDICAFKNCLFFLCTSNAQSQQITLLAVGGSSGVTNTDTITIGANTFTAITGTPSAGSNNYQIYSSGSPSQNVNQTAINLVACINQSTSNTTIYAYYVSSTNGLPGQILLVNRSYSSAAFSVTVSAHGSGWSANNVALPTSGTSVTSTNTSNLNGLMYSKQGQPEGVPALNIFYPGSASAQGYRIIALRDSLFILKSDGVFRLSGTSPADFTIDTLDNTVFITVPDSAVALNNCVYAMTTQGVAQITDSGVSVISRPIEDQLNQIVGTVGNTNMSKYAFGIAYESDRKYFLYTPQASNDTSATVGYVYNYFTKTWVTVARSQYCGYVFSVDNKLYLGNTASNSVSQERKNYTYTDYTDESVGITITASSGITITLSSAANVSAGDIITQSTSSGQVLSIAGNVVTLNTSNTWSNASASCLKSFLCTMQWVPTAGQNPGMLKQYSEGLLVFRQSQFTSATMSYLSDIKPVFEPVPFVGIDGLGWGLSVWGSTIWGGVVTPGTSRHYIPRDMQRCTLLTPQFTMQSGWSTFLLEGLSLQYRTISPRTSR